MSERPPVQIEPWEMLDILSGLVEKNLVLVETHDGESRYRMLETVRQYAREHLFESNQGKETRDRHTAFFNDFVEQHGLIRGRERLERLATLEADFDNIRAAIEWATESPDDSQYAFRICFGLFQYWSTTESGREGFERCKAALSALPKDPTLYRGRCLGVAGACARSMGDLDLSLRYFDEALEIVQSFGERDDQASVQTNIGFTRNIQGKADEAEQHLRKALEIWTESDNPVRLGIVYNNLGDTYRLRGDPAGARQCYERSLAYAKEARDDYSLGVNYLNLGDTAVLEGDYPTAIEFYQKGRSHARQGKAPLLEAFTMMATASVLVGQGSISGVPEIFEEAIQMLRRTGTQNLMVGFYSRLALFALQLGDPPTAIRLLAAADALDTMRHRAIEPPLIGDPMEEARSKVDPAAFESLWDEGRALSYDQSVDLALSFLRSAQ